MRCAGTHRDILKVGRKPERQLQLPRWKVIAVPNPSVRKGEGEQQQPDIEYCQPPEDFRKCGIDHRWPPCRNVRWSPGEAGINGRVVYDDDTDATKHQLDPNEQQ